jgi:arabinofuranosyltransferase
VSTETPAAPPPRPGTPAAVRLALWLAIALFGLVLVRTAWLCDDAYITYRTVDNLLGGHGPTWNPGERVQVHAHPLWMLAVAGATALTGEVYTAAIGLSMLLSLGAVVVAARAAGSGPEGVLVVLVLALSRAFTDWSTGGLENPLSHLLLALLLLRVLGREEPERRLFEVALLTGLATLTRIDAVLVYGPLLAVLFWRRRGARALGLVAAGLAPFLAWEVFSVVYYGFPFPNVAYAKLGTGIPRAEVWAQGLHYVASSARSDPLTPTTVALGLALGFAGRRGGAWLAGRPLAAGAVLHLAYVVSIGGDFMAGRMLTVPLLATAVLAARRLGELPRTLSWPAAAVLVVLGLASPAPTFLSGADLGLDERVSEAGDGRGVVDERRVYYPATGLLSPRRRGPAPAHAWAAKGAEARAAGAAVVERKTIGFFGFHAGPGVHVVDRHALADPLLARIPRIVPVRRGGERTWRVGHYERAVPEGYLETRATGENRIRDPDLAAYWDELSRVVSGPLFTAERWRSILGFLTGRFDGRMRAYVESLDG